MGPTLLGRSRRAPLLVPPTSDPQPVLIVATEVALVGRLVTLALSLSIDSIAEPSPAWGEKNGGVAKGSEGCSVSAEAPFRAAWPARVRAEARSSSAAAL